MSRVLPVIACVVIGCAEAPANTDPLQLEFGQGSGWHGLDTIKIDPEGRVVLHRLNFETKDDVQYDFFETGTLQLDEKGRARVARAVQKNGLMELDEEYSSEIRDGTQWVLWLRQGQNEKAVYFNNNFPSAIKAFSTDLDGILADAGKKDVEWARVPPGQARKHEDALWESIKSK